MNLRLRIVEIQKIQEDLEANGYTKEEALLIIQAAAISHLSDCINLGYDNKSFLRIGGAIATYEQ